MPVNLNRVAMPKRDPKTRIGDFEEVALGYTLEQAVEEARRCLECPKRPCVLGCPVDIAIPDFVTALEGGDLPTAVGVLKNRNSLPGICGRVCPQESQCEASCVLAKRGAPVSIGRLERYIADWEQAEGPSARPPVAMARPSHKKVAVVGSGPAGLAAAAELARMGHEVVIFEALHDPGGVLVYGIPEFRLPKAIVRAEVDYVKSLGVEVRMDWVVGQTVTVDELLGNGYHAAFLGTGAGLPQFLGIPGENLGGIYSANEFLVRTNLMKAYLFPEYDTPLRVGKRVVVIGAGNVAMDAARCALRLGASEVSIVYRRTRAEMPARHEEVENAEEEGLNFRLLTNPLAFLGDANGMVTGMDCMEMELGEPDASGRPRPVPKKGSEFTLDVDTVVVALGTTPNPLLSASTPGLDTNPLGTVVANGEAGRTSRDGVWAGGDLVTGAATVISAMGAGRQAAADIDDYLRR